MSTNTTSNRTLTIFNDQAALWNAYAAAMIRLHCPETSATFESSGATCPECFGSLSDRSHWKWYSPDEPQPDPAEWK